MAIRNQAAVLPKPPYSGHQIILSCRASELDGTSYASYMLSNIEATLAISKIPIKLNPYNPN